MTSIERELDSADRDAASRGVVLEERRRSKAFAEKGEIPLEKAIERCGVVVVRAPKGMSRSKQNATKVTKKWVHDHVATWLGNCAGADC